MPPALAVDKSGAVFQSDSSPHGRRPQLAPTRPGLPPRGYVPALHPQGRQAMAVSYMQPETTTQLWEQVLEAVRSRLASQQAYDTWFRPVVPRHLSPQIVELEVP